MAVGIVDEDGVARRHLGDLDAHDGERLDGLIDLIGVDAERHVVHLLAAVDVARHLEKVETLGDGVALAQAVIDDGRAKAALEALIAVTAA